MLFSRKVSLRLLWGGNLIAVAYGAYLAGYHWLEYRAVRAVVGAAAVPSDDALHDLESAVENVKQFRKGTAAIAPLIERLDGADQDIAYRIRWSLERLGTVVLPDVSKALTDSRRDIRAGVLPVLVRLKRTEALPELLAALADPDAVVRETALWGFAVVPQEPVIAVPELVRNLSDPNPRIRRWAAVALERLGPEAKESVPALIRALNDQSCDRGDAVLRIGLHTYDEFDVRSVAVEALGAIGPAASEAVPCLESLLDHGDSELSERVRKSLQQIEAQPHNAKESAAAGGEDRTTR